MKTTIRLQLAMAGSANAFCKAHPDPNPGGQTMAARLDQLVGRAATLVQQQRASQMAASSAVEHKAGLRETIGTHLASLVGIARTAARSDPAVTIHLRLPRGRPNDPSFLALCRVAVAEGAARKDLLLSLGMPDGLLDQMTAELNQFEEATIRQRTAIAAQVGAGAELTSVTREILAVLKHLDALHRLRFGDDPELAATWKSARNVAYPAPAPAQGADDGAAPAPGPETRAA